ncbi:glycosyltransferase [Spiribacter roseus]|uniref:Glycosyltransferase n=1 Tax=Spiribacter roseus TaxID=1855875 RepID=A0ABV3S2X4_9GAMM
MTTLNILFLPSWYPKHPSDIKGVFFRDQALALAEYGHKIGVVAVTMRSLRTLGHHDEDTAGPEYEVDEGIPTYRRQVWAALPRIPYGNYWLWRRAARGLLTQYVREQGWPDVIHAHSAIYAGAVAADWAREHGIPVVLTEHRSGFARGVYRSWQLKLAEEAAVGADTCIAVSPEFGKTLGRQLPQSRGQWIWVPNVVASRFHLFRSDADDHQRPVRLLNLASMVKIKGQMDLLDAFARLPGSVSSPTELWMGGDGPLRPELERRTRELGIDRHVRFLKAVPPAEVPALLAQVDIMVVSSHYETFGVVAAEALMAGVPVVATRCGGPECIVGEGDGRLVPSRDPQALASAMAEWVERSNQIDHQAISERAKARFSEGAVVKQLTAVYKDVCHRRSL